MERDTGERRPEPTRRRDAEKSQPEGAESEYKEHPELPSETADRLGDFA